MPEQEQPTTPAEDTAPKQPDAPVAAGMTAEQIKALTQSTISEALETYKGQSQQEIAAARQEAEAMRQRLGNAVNALQGESTGNKSSERQLLESFLTNPGPVLEDKITQALIKYDEQKTAVSRAKEDFERAVNVERHRREEAGVRMSEKDWQALGGYYELTDESLPEDARIKEAFKMQDEYLESLGLGSLEERIKKAASVPSNSASATSGPQENTFDEVAEQKKELEANAASYRRKMNIDD